MLRHTARYALPGHQAYGTITWQCTERLSFLSDDLKAKLQRLAAETGRGEADPIREGIRLALAERLPPPPRSGIFDSGDPSLSERVDELLQGFGER